MSLQYIADSYNITNHPSFSPFCRKTKNPCRALIAFIKNKKAGMSSRNKFILVFDGYPNASDPMRESGSIEIIFSREDSADDRIKRMVESSPNPKNIAVISDDREIIFFARSAGAQAISVEEFTCPKEKLRHVEKRDSLKQELNYSQAQKINQELKKLWLKD